MVGFVYSTSQGSGIIQGCLFCFHEADVKRALGRDMLYALSAHPVIPAHLCTCGFCSLTV